MVEKKGKRRAEKVEEKMEKMKAGCRSPLVREDDVCPTTLRKKTRGRKPPEAPTTHTYILVDTSQSLAHAIEQATCISASLNSNPVGLLTRTYFSLLW